MASNALSKNGFKNPVFLSKSSKFRVVWTIQFCSNSTACGLNTYQIMYGEPLVFQFQHCNGSRGNFNGKFTALLRVFYITIADDNIGSLKSLLTLFDNYVDHMLVKYEQNLMVRTIQNFELFWQKMVNHFWQSVDAILENVSVVETIVWC